jgi:type IV pilus assembly protein PilB
MAEEYHRKYLGEILIKNGALNQKNLSYVLSKKKITRQRLGNICIQEGLCSEEDVAKAIAEQFGMQYIDLDKEERDEELLKQAPFDKLISYNVAPVKIENGRLIVAMRDPFDFAINDELEILYDVPIDVAIATEKSIKNLLSQEQKSITFLREATEKVGLQLVRETETGEELLSLETLESDESSPIVKLVNTTIFDAITNRASDIHIEATSEGVIIRYRIDGVLHRATDPIQIKNLPQIISRIKVISELDISETRIPQDGRFKLWLNNRSIDFRVSILPTVLGENAVIRILDKENTANELKGLKLENLGLNLEHLKTWNKTVRMPYGLILVTGPTGSGKSTTLYSALSKVNRDIEKVITIEDPVEYQLDGVMQIQVAEKKGLTFAKGLRSILRHDPDKILVGEIRDSETAKIAIQSAQTGHLVFSTVHANNVFEVFARFAHMGIDRFSLVSSLICIAGQRLARLLCPHCKIPYKPSSELLQELRMDNEINSNLTFFEKKGCSECNGTGFKGRTSIMEILLPDDEIKELIVSGQQTHKIKDAAMRKGMRTLRQSALGLVSEGKTTIEEINRITFAEEM